MGNLFNCSSGEGSQYNKEKPRIEIKGLKVQTNCSVAGISYNYQGYCYLPFDVAEDTTLSIDITNADRGGDSSGVYVFNSNENGDRLEQIKLVQRGQKDDINITNYNYILLYINVGRTYTSGSTVGMKVGSIKIW